MQSISHSDNVLSLRLQQGNRYGHDIFQLNQSSFSSLNLMIITTLERERSVMLVCNGLDGKRKKLDILNAMRAGLVEILESGKEEPIVFNQRSLNSLGNMEIPPKPSPQHYQVRAGLETDTTSDEWRAVMQSGSTYELRLSNNEGEVWCYYSDEHNGPPEEVPSSKRLPVGREDGAIHFTVHDDPAPPEFLATLRVEPEKCHLSGNPPFKFIIEFTTNSDQPITVDKSRTPLSDFPFDFNSVSQLIYCEDAKTGEEVEWPSQFGCFDQDPRPDFPEDSDFVEILAEKPWRFEYTLEKEGSSDVGGLEYLKLGRTYKAQVATKHLGGFSRYLFGRKEDLLKGSIEEKKQRWNDHNPDQVSIHITQQNEHVVFQVVK